MKFSVSWDRLSAFLSQGIEADTELSLESKIAVSLALLGEQTLEGSAHEFNNYFASAVSAGRSEFIQAIERLNEGPLPDQKFWRSMNNRSTADVTIYEITTTTIQNRIQNHYQKFMGACVNKKCMVAIHSQSTKPWRPSMKLGMQVPSLYSDSDIFSAAVIQPLKRRNGPE